jgi:hypothetical protein
MMFLSFLLTTLLLTTASSAGVPCTTTEYCTTQSPLSQCVEGFCTNPFQDSCLLSTSSTVSTYKKRVCSSLDQGSTDHCEPNIFAYQEVRLFPGNWESAMFTAWVAQIYLSEILRVPVTIETASPDTNTDFYHPSNTFAYPSSGYSWESLKNAAAASNGVCPQSKASSTKNYKPCAHAMLEVWPSGNTNQLNTMIKEGYGEVSGSIGGYGTISWYTFERVIALDPTLKSYHGFSNRIKIANLYKRPVSWYDYCITHAYGTCDSSDSFVTSKPSSKEEGSIYYKAGGYKGFFKGDNCTKNPTTCTGYAVNAPCDWSTFMDAQIRWSLPSGEPMALKTAGPLEDGGYSYGQMLQIYEAAGLQNENILIWWWEPTPDLEKWRVDAKWKLTPIVLPDYNKDCVAKRPTHAEKCSATQAERQGRASHSGGAPGLNAGCSNPIELLSKIFSKGLRSQLKTDYSDFFGSEIAAVQTPSHGFLQSLQVDTPFLKELLYEWRYGGLPAASYPTNLWARDAVCRAVRNITTVMKQYIPAGHPKTAQIVPVPADFVVLQILCGICIFVCLAVMVVVHLKRETTKIRSSQPIFLQLILFGGAVLYVSCILQLQRGSSCSMKYVTMLFGWGTFFVPLLLKTYRLHAVFDAAKKMKRVKITTSTLIKMLLAWLIIVEGTFSLLIAFVIRLSPQSLYVPDPSDTTILLSHVICQSVTDDPAYGYIYGIGVFLNCILVLVGVVLAIRTRNITSKFSESSQLAAMMYTSLLFAILVAVFSFLPSKNPDFFARAYMVLLFVGITFCLLILFVPKFVDLEDESMSGMGNGPRTTTRSHSGNSQKSQKYSNNSSGNNNSSQDNRKHSDNSNHASDTTVEITTVKAVKSDSNKVADTPAAIVSL